MRARQHLPLTRSNLFQAVVDALSQNPGLFEKIRNATTGDPAENNEFWRDLVQSKSAIAELGKEGASLKELRDKAASMTRLVAPKQVMH